MNIQEQINVYIDSLYEAKRSDLKQLYQYILQMLPLSKLWFLDGKNENGKVIANPNIGFGQFNIKYKDGSTKEFYQVGISGNSTGISVYIMGLDDNEYLLDTFGTTIGKANVTGYCIKFKKLKDINLDILGKAIRYGIEKTSRH